MKIKIIKKKIRKIMTKKDVDQIDNIKKDFAYA